MRGKALRLATGLGSAVLAHADLPLLRACSGQGASAERNRFRGRRWGDDRGEHRCDRSQLDPPLLTLMVGVGIPLSFHAAGVVAFAELAVTGQLNGPFEADISKSPLPL